MEPGPVRLVAVCDLLDERPSGSSATLDDDPGPFSFSYTVEEHALLADGRRLVLHRDRGFSSSGPASDAQELAADVLTTVLPDDAEETGDDHPWDWLCQLLKQHGVTTTSAALRLVPYEVEITDRALATVKGADS